MAKYKIRLEGNAYEVTVDDTATGARVTVEGRTFEVEPAVVRAPLPTTSHAAAPSLSAAAQPAPSVRPSSAPAGGGSGSIHAPIPGVITTVCVKVGDQVAAGDVVLRLEAMKMENDINSPVAGTVKEIAVSDGAEVKDGQLLVVIG